METIFGLFIVRLGVLKVHLLILLNGCRDSETIKDIVIYVISTDVRSGEISSIKEVISPFQNLLSKPKHSVDIY